MKVLTRIIGAALTLILIGLIIHHQSNTFDETALQPGNIIRHLEELTSAPYNGRLTGSEGDRKTLAYIEEHFRTIGLTPAGEDGGWYQEFSVLLPEIDQNTRFTVADTGAGDTGGSGDTGETIEFILYEDYNLAPTLNGSIDFQGEIVIAENSLYRLTPEIIKDRIIVVEAAGLDQKKINFVLEHGGAGIFCSADTRFFGKPNLYETEKIISTAGKNGQSIVSGYLSRTTYRRLQETLDEKLMRIKNETIGLVKGVTLSTGISYPIVSTANILGSIEARGSSDRILMITANIDGSGAGTGDRYFPGAVSSTSGIAALLETARVIAGQDRLPYRQIIFAGWNAQQQNAGSAYYVDNPLFPLEKTTVIHLQALGEPSLEGVKVASDAINGTILKDNILNYGRDAGAAVQPAGPMYGAVSPFTDKNAAAATLTDAPGTLDNYEDTLEKIDPAAMSNAVMPLLSYSKRVIFKDTGIDYLTPAAILIIGIFTLGVVINLVLGHLYRTSPNKKLFGSNIEDIYFQTPAFILRKIYFYLAVGLTALLLLSFLARIDPGFNIKTINHERVTNFSWYLTLKEILLSLQNLFQAAPVQNAGSRPSFSIIFSAAYRSLILLTSGILLSTLIGVASGILEGYKLKRTHLRSLGTLIIFSIPDVLVVLTGLLIYIFIARNFPAVKEALPLNTFILPLITVSIIPTIYISRITFITIQSELQKDYIRNARAKGMSRRTLFTSEMLPAVLYKTADSLPAIMTILLSNLIIVEYLFNYLGIVYYLLYFYTRHEAELFIALAVTLGLIYLLFTWGIQQITRYSNPLKREAGK